MEAGVIEYETKDNKNNNKSENKNENKVYKFIENNQKLYQIVFSKKMNHIKIKCNDTNNVNDIYTKKLFFDECKQSNKYLEFLGNISTIFDLINNMKSKDFIIKSQNKSLILIINFKHLDIKYPLNILLQKEEDLLKIIEELKNENAILKIRLEDEVEYKKNLINIYNSNIIYNLNFDNTLYKLDDVYNTITHDIIEGKEDLGLINFGIKDLLSKNLKNCILTYKYSTNSKNLSDFLPSISSIINILIVLRTTNHKRFGVFYQNKNKNNTNDVDNSYCGNCNEKIKRGIKRLFYTCCKKGKSFIFSFDKFKLYEKSNENPNFNIKYDYNRECLFGNEFILKKQPKKRQLINNNNGNNNINQNNILLQTRTKEFDTISCSSFILHGNDRNSEEFNILDLEVYEIKLHKNNKK